MSEAIEPPAICRAEASLMNDQRGPSLGQEGAKTFIIKRSSGAARSHGAVYVQGHKVGPGPLSRDLRSEFTYSIIATPAAVPMPKDKRHNERLRTRLRAGHLSDRRNTVIVDCLIQDRSHTGARLRLALDRPLPKSFLLSDEISQTKLWAELVWQRGRDVGVKLTDI